MSNPAPALPVLWDKPLAGTPFRGLILRTAYCCCAYIGAPQECWLADMQELQFECHSGVNFLEPGDGGLRPAGWFWYGWDYGHAGDQMLLLQSLPPELAAMLPEGLKGHLEAGKSWTLAEIEQELIDAAVSLSHAMACAGHASDAALRELKARQP